jgi:hypothetical protein
LPSTHVGLPSSALGQALAQSPQFSTSRVVSRHASPHFSKPGSQLKLQLPSQTGVPCAGAEQAAPHAPQLAMSWLLSTQALPQVSWPAAHFVWQVPSVQTCLVSHFLPHSPQWLGSLSVSTHSSSQAA